MWYKQKTTWTGIGAVIAAAGGFLTGTMSVVDALQTAILGLTGIFLREGINKVK